MMLRQEVNLYKFFKDPIALADWLSLDKFLFYNSLIFLFLILLYIFSAWSNHRLEAQVIQAQGDVAQLQNNFYKLREKFPPIFFTQDINQSVKQIQNEIHAQEDILESLSNPVLLSKQLASFSQSIVPQVWLTEISINKGGDHIELTGDSLKMENLQGFIKNLSQHPLYATYRLTVNDISNENTPGNSNLHFQITLEKKENGHE